MAESTVGEADQPATREARIREASTGLVEKFPLKKKK